MPPVRLVGRRGLHGVAGHRRVVEPAALRPSHSSPISSLSAPVGQWIAVSPIPCLSNSSAWLRAEPNSTSPPFWMCSTMAVTPFSTSGSGGPAVGHDGPDPRRLPQALGQEFPVGHVLVGREGVVTVLADQQDLGLPLRTGGESAGQEPGGQRQEEASFHGYRSAGPPLASWLLAAGPTQLRNSSPDALCGRHGGIIRESFRGGGPGVKKQSKATDQ